MCQKWGNPEGDMLRFPPLMGIGDAPPSLAVASPNFDVP
jgi:hypothetical protein